MVTKKYEILRICRSFLLPAALPMMLSAQAISTTRVSTNVHDAVFTVDGQAYSGSALFSWPAGSKHILSIGSWQFAAGQTQTRYTFTQWSTAAGTLSSPAGTVTITANPSITWYNADLTVEYALTLNFFRFPSPPCSLPGIIFVNQVAHAEDADTWLPAGSTVVLEAVPQSGFVFAGWMQNPTLPPLYSLILNAATVVYPKFSLARSIRFSTSPQGLDLLADRAKLSAPAALDWGWNSEHSIAALSPQTDQTGHAWVFGSWSDGGAAQHSYTVTPGNEPVALTATFTRGVAVGLFTEPSGLNLTVDGGDSASPRYFVWAPGDRHAAAAPARQIDSEGAPWFLTGWSDGNAPSRTITPNENQVETGIRLTARYEAAGRVRVESVPDGLAFAVDGVTCRTPCEIERRAGTAVRVSAPATLDQGGGARLDLVSWDGLAGENLVIAAGYCKITARYRLSYRLSLNTEPSGAGSWRLEPPSPDGFYPAGTSVSVAIDRSAGLQFRAWAGDSSGSANPMLLLMDAPHALLALFDRIPEKPVLRVLNSAGETPVKAVAAGSIASLFGAALSDTTAVSTTDPLPQSLAGVTLLCAGRILPLLYASPGQINFQVPAALLPDTYRLEVHREGAAILAVDMVVVRNAPGLLVAAHDDGSPVTPDSPVKRGERVSLYATGLGPLQPSPPDGFQVPRGTPFVVFDPVDVQLDGRSLEHEPALATPGMTGVAVIPFRMPQDTSDSRTVRIELRSGEAMSNALDLPVNLISSGNH